MALSRRQFMKMAAVSAATLSFGMQMGCDDDSESVRFAVVSDVHLYDTSLGTSGGAFELYMGTGTKLLVESEPILRTVVDRIKKSDAQFVLMPGDMSKDGERVCHELMVSYLAELKAAGKPVFVVPGNHDVLNPMAYSYSGDSVTPVANVTPEEFAEIYQDYGYGAAIARDPDSLSYVAEPCPGYWLLAMDSCIYENNTTGKLILDGEFSEATMGWIKARLAEAHEQGKTVIGLMHHAITEHFDGQSTLFPGFVINDWQTVSQTLAQEGLKFVFTGHFHATDATDRSWTGPEALIHDIETGSLTTAPCPWRHVHIGDGFMRVSTSQVTEVDGFNDATQTFPEYARSLGHAGLTNMYTLTYMAPPYDLTRDEAEKCASQLADALLGHYAGDEKPDEATRQMIQAYLDSPDAEENNFGQCLSTLWTDLTPTDNFLLVPMD